MEEIMTKREIILMGWCNKDITPLLTHWSYVFLALTYRYVDAYLTCGRITMVTTIGVLTQFFQGQLQKQNNFLTQSLIFFSPLLQDCYMEDTD